jgi:hypothetical protein
MGKKKRQTPVHVIVYKDTLHSYTTLDVPPEPRVFMPETFNWHFAPNPGAAKDTMDTILAAIKTKKYLRNTTEYR